MDLHHQTHYTCAHRIIVLEGGFSQRHLCAPTSFSSAEVACCLFSYVLLLEQSFGKRKSDCFAYMNSFGKQHDTKCLSNVSVY
jgi:hypothetical protein